METCATLLLGVLTFCAAFGVVRLALDTAEYVLGGDEED
jgi:hypothetical protein